MHTEEIPFELPVSVNSSSVCGSVFAKHPECVRGLLGREHGGPHRGHDSTDCETALVGSMMDPGQTSREQTERGLGHAMQAPQENCDGIGAGWSQSLVDIK